MIRGSVSSDLQPIISVIVRGPSGRSRIVEAMVDTGFNGALTLPPLLARELDLPWVGLGNATVGDGHESSFDVYEASVEWGGEERQALVDAVDMQPLVGMSLLYAQRLTITILPGGGVTIQDVDG